MRWATLLEAAAASVPLVALLEDIQWADPSTIDLVRHLVGRITRKRILLLGTLRPGELEAAGHPSKGFVSEMRGHEHCHQIALGLFDTGDVARYLEVHFSPNRFPPDLPDLVHRKTEGHPLFVISLAQLLAERGDIVRTGEEWTLSRPVSEAELETPESVRGMVRRKVEALEEPDRLALQYASVIGKEFLTSVLAGLLNADELTLEERLHQLDRAHRLIDRLGEEELPDGTLATRYRFTHSLYQEVLYEDLVARRRALLHRQVAQRLAALYGSRASRFAGQIALHFERGRDFGAAAEYRQQAGDQAATVYAYGEAREHFDHALLLLEKLPEAERAERAPALYQRRGSVNLAVRRFDSAVDDYTRMLEAARTAGSARLECAALARLCRALFFSHRIEEMALRAHEALAAATRAGEEPLQVDALVLVAQILQDEGNLAEAKTVLEEIVATAKRLDHKPALLEGLAYRGSVHYWQSEYGEAERRFAEALELASEQRDGFMVLVCLMFTGLSQGNQGRMAEALATLGKGIAMARRNGDHFWLPRLVSHVGWVHRELHSFDLAIRHDQEGLRIAREDGIAEAEASSLLNLALDYIHAGRLDEAAAALDELQAETKPSLYGWHHEIRMQGALADLWLRRGDLERAGVHAHKLFETARHHEARTYILGAHRLLAEVALESSEPAAAAHLAAAVEQLRQHPAPLMAWKIHATLGHMLSRVGDRKGAREAYGEAAAVIRTLSGQVGDETLRAQFLGSPMVRAILEGAGPS